MTDTLFEIRAKKKKKAKTAKPHPSHSHTHTRSHGQQRAHGQHVRSLCVLSELPPPHCRCSLLTAMPLPLPVVSAVPRTSVSRGPSCRRSSCARVETRRGAIGSDGVERQRRRRRSRGGGSRRRSLLCAGQHQSAGFRCRTQRGQLQRSASQARRWHNAARWISAWLDRGSHSVLTAAAPHRAAPRPLFFSGLSPQVKLRHQSLPDRANVTCEYSTASFSFSERKQVNKSDR